MVSSFTISTQRCFWSNHSSKEQPTC